MYISHSRQLQSLLTADNVKLAPLFPMPVFCDISDVRFVCNSLYIRDERPDGIQKYDLRWDGMQRTAVHPCSRLSQPFSDYAKFDEIVQMSYLYSRPRVQDWPALRKWQARN